MTVQTAEPPNGLLPATDRNGGAVFLPGHEFAAAIGELADDIAAEGVLHVVYRYSRPPCVGQSAFSYSPQNVGVLTDFLEENHLNTHLPGPTAAVRIGYFEHCINHEIRRDRSRDGPPRGAWV